MGKATLTMETSFPDGDAATIRVVLPSPKAFTLAVRRPVWAGDGFAVAVNGDVLPQPPLASLTDAVAGGRAGAVGNESENASSSFVSITRTWKSGDVVTLALPKTLRFEPTPDNPSVTAIMWGPLAMAGDMGPRGGRTPENAQTTPRTVVPMLVSTSRQPSDFVKPTSTPGNFLVTRAARVPELSAPDGDVSLTPFYRTHRHRYSLYFDLVTPTEFSNRVAALNDARSAAARLEAATVGTVVVGDTASESAANYVSEPKDRVVTRTERRAGRGGSGWFSYDLAADASAPMSLVVTHFVEPGLPAPIGGFDMMVGGTRVAHYTPNTKASGFYQAQYDVPTELTTGRSTVTVRFEAVGTGRIVPVFGIRMVRR